MQSKTLLYQGLLASPASWARVGREYVTRLAAEPDLELAAVHVRGFGYDPDFPAPAGVPMIEARDLDDRPDPVWGLGFLHPPLLERLRGNRRGNLFVWESTRLPAGWVEHLNTRDLMTIVPSVFVAETLLAEGVSPTQVAIVPYGYTPGQPRNTARADETFQIRSVGAPHWRKGHRELLTAYRRAFTKIDDVHLTIKSTYDPGTRKKQQPFEIPSWNSLLADCGLHDANAASVDVRCETTDRTTLPSSLNPLTSMLRSYPSRAPNSTKRSASCAVTRLSNTTIQGPPTT